MDVTDPEYPQNDEIWASNRDCTVKYCALFAAPGGDQTGFYNFPAREQVRITDIFDERPSVITFVPVRLYNELREQIPQRIRSNPRYTTYRLSLDVGTFEKEFTRIKPRAQP